MEEIVRDRAWYQNTGRNAFRLGLNSFNCPYPAGSKEARWWMEGYAEARAQKVRPLEVSQKDKPTPVANVVSVATKPRFRHPQRFI
jgi:hypothetical protein